MNIMQEMKRRLAAALREAAASARAAGELTYETLPDFVIEAPRDKSHGDFAANLALLLAKAARQAPRQVAEIIVRHLEMPQPGVARIEVAGPGFINFILDRGGSCRYCRPSSLKTNITAGQISARGSRSRWNLSAPIPPGFYTWVTPGERP